MKEEIVLDGMEFMKPGVANRSVLISKTSKLVSIIILDPKRCIYTIDSEYLVRMWNLKTGKATNSYLLNSSSKKKLTFATTDKMFKLLAISNEAGDINVHNIYSGGLLY